jgi:hypothetical protein
VQAAINGQAITPSSVAVGTTLFGIPGAKHDGVTDDTAAIQAAFNSSHDITFTDGTYIIDPDGAGGDSNSGGVTPQSNSVIQCTGGAVLQAKTSSLTGYNILRLNQVSNVKVIGCTIVGDRSTHNGSTGEWGYGIGIWGSTDIWLEDLIVSNCWGDGIYINRAQYPSQAYRSARIHGKGALSTNNRRQGMSVIDGDDIEFTDSNFTYTQGTAPQAGIDVEPGGYGNIVNNFSCIGCNFTGNSGDGFVASGQANGTITSWAISGNVLTVIGTNLSNFVNNGTIPVYITGLAHGSYLNGVALTLTSATSTTLTASYSGANDSATESGTVTSWITNGVKVIGGKSLNNAGVGVALNYNMQSGFIGAMDILSNGSTGFVGFDLPDGGATFANNKVTGNVTAGGGSPNAQIQTSVNVVVTGNIIRANPTNANQPGSGLNLNSNTGTFVSGNDVRFSNPTPSKDILGATATDFLFNNLTTTSSPGGSGPLSGTQLNLQAATPYTGDTATLSFNSAAWVLSSGNARVLALASANDLYFQPAGQFTNGWHIAGANASLLPLVDNVSVIGQAGARPVSVDAYNGAFDAVTSNNPLISPSSVRLYNDPGTNQEAGAFEWSANVLNIGTKNLGSGVNRVTSIVSDSDLYLQSGATDRWHLASPTGFLLPVLDNTYSIGQSGAAVANVQTNQINGANIPASAAFLGTNSSKQLVSVTPSYAPLNNPTGTGTSTWPIFNASTGFAGTTPVATFTLGNATTAGTGATASCVTGFVCDQFSGTIALTTGTGITSAQFNNAAVTITFPVTRTNIPTCVVSVANTSNGVMVGSVRPLASTSTLAFLAYSTTTFLPSNNYQIGYICGGV